MANQPNQTLPRWAGCCLALAFAGFFAQPTAADTISHSGTFFDPTTPDTVTDNFSITNTSPDSYDITALVIDFSTVTTAPVSFDEADFPFVAGPEAAATGFVADVTTPGLMILTFTDFNAGETFTFTIDVDDNNFRVQSVRIAGATITATFDIMGIPTDVVASMIAGGAYDTNWSNSATVVPEPGTLTLLGLGLTGLAWRGRRRR